MVRGIFARVANGESTMSAECVRLTALGVPRRQRYGGDKGTDQGADVAGWDKGVLGGHAPQPDVQGRERRVDSRHGTVERPAEPLVDEEDLGACPRGAGAQPDPLEEEREETSTCYADWSSAHVA